MRNWGSPWQVYWKSLSWAVLAPPACPPWVESKYAKGSESLKNYHKSLTSIYRYVFFWHISISLQVTDKAAVFSTPPLEHAARIRIIGREGRQEFLWAFRKTEEKSFSLNSQGCSPPWAVPLTSATRFVEKDRKRHSFKH